MNNTERELKLLTTGDGKCPFEDWFNGLRDEKVQLTVLGRLLRVIGGNFGVYKSVGGGVQELKIDFGPGYRVYFAEVGNTIIVLIAGGVKRTQEADIKKATRMWEEAKNEPERRERGF